MEETSDSKFCCVVLNGVYEGVYEFCEQVRVGKTRVNIFDWNDLAEEAAEKIASADRSVNEDELAEALESGFEWTSAPYEIKFGENTYKVSDFVTIPKTTGGFLLEMDFWAMSMEDDLSRLFTEYDQPWYFNTPENVSEASGLYKYTYNYIQSFEYTSF